MEGPPSEPGDENQSCSSVCVIAYDGYPARAVPGNMVTYKPIDPERENQNITPNDVIFNLMCRKLFRVGKLDNGNNTDGTLRNASSFSTIVYIALNADHPAITEEIREAYYNNEMELVFKELDVNGNEIPVNQGTGQEVSEIVFKTGDYTGWRTQSNAAKNACYELSRRVVNTAEQVNFSIGMRI